MAAKVRWKTEAWWVVIHHQGRRTVRRVGATRRDKQVAEKIAEKVNASLILGTYGQERDEEVPLPCATQLRDWLITYSPTLKPATEILYSGLIRNHLAPQFGETDLREIREADLLRFIRAKRDKGLSPRTIENALSVLRRVYSLHVSEGVIHRNPVSRIGALMRRVERASASETPEAESWSRAEVQELLRVARMHEARFAPLLSILFSTGMRRGEALGLQWRDVDLDQRRIRIARSLGKDGLTTPKSGRARRIPMTPALAPELFDLLTFRRQETLSRGWPDTPVFVFVSEIGTPLDPRNVHRVWERVRRRAQKQGVRPLKLHAARHTWATLALQSGKSIRWVADVLGHSDPALTLRVYAHAMREEEVDLGFAEFEDGTGRHYAALVDSDRDAGMANPAEILARRAGLEPATLRFEA